MKAKVLVLLSYLCLYVTGQNDEERDWKTEWSDKYKEEDTIPFPWEQSGQSEGDIVPDTQSEISARNINYMKQWPGGNVRYEFKDGDFSFEEQKLIRDTMEDLSKIIRRFHRYLRSVSVGSRCHLEFYENPSTHNHQNYVIIVKPAKSICTSNVGMQTTRQYLKLGSGCLNRPTILHELLHILGFAHQQSAIDRDNYIRILDHNIEDAYKDQFEKVSSNDYTDYGISYDFYSIMHYSPFAFAKKNSRGSPVGPTMQAIDPNQRLQKNDDLSPKDTQKLMKMFCH